MIDMLFVEIAFYGLGFMAVLLKSRENSALGFVKVFLPLNMAALVSTYCYSTVKTNVRWKQS